MKIIFLPLTALFLFTANLSFGQTGLVDKVIAVVGDKIILHSDIEEQVQFLEAQEGSIPENGRCLMIDQMITQKLFLVQANIDSLVVSEEEVEGQLNARIDQILRYMDGNVEQFEAYYGKSVQAVKEDFRTDIEDQMITERQQASVVENVSVTPAEVKRFFNEIPKDSLPYFNAEVEVSEVVIKPKVNDAELKRAFDKLDKIKNEIINDGKDFGEAAGVYSDDPGSAAKGGSLGWVKRGELVPEFEAAAFRLEPMEYSPIVKTDYGYHFIQLIERRGNTINARHILVKPEITFDDKDLVKAKLDTIKNLIVTDSISFGRAVKRYSEDDQSKNNAGRLLNAQTGTSTFEVRELTPEVYFAIEGMKVGDVSDPLEFVSPQGETAYRIIRLDTKSDPHVANLRDDYSKIQAAATEQKKLKKMESWVDEKVGSMYINISEDYKQCPELDKWANQTTTKLR